MRKITKAFEVTYSGGGYNGMNAIVLVNKEEEVEQALEEKSSRKYTSGSSWCKIEYCKEIPLSKVKISDLSVTEFMKITGR